MSEQKRLIDANSLIDCLKEVDMGNQPFGSLVMAGLNYAIKAINESPTVAAVPVVHARWEKHTNASVQCSSCEGFVLMRYKFCPNCGAKMDK